MDDSTFLWMRNTPNADARRIMLRLGLDYVRYDRVDGVVCAWSGGGMLAARGYVTRLPDAHPPTDRLGEACMRAGACTETPLTEDWTAFRCD